VIKNNQTFRIISGGQTGVDRAALDAAIFSGIPCGGFCPKNRRADDDQIPLHYPLIEISSADYPVRTRLNIEHSDGTLILICGVYDRGTSLTAEICRKMKKPLLIVDLEESDEISYISGWIETSHICTLNIAGPREKSSPGIYKSAVELLEILLIRWGG